MPAAHAWGAAGCRGVRNRDGRRFRRSRSRAARTARRATGPRGSAAGVGSSPPRSRRGRRYGVARGAARACRRGPEGDAVAEGCPAGRTACSTRTGSRGGRRAACPGSGRRRAAGAVPWTRCARARRRRGSGSEGARSRRRRISSRHRSRVTPDRPYRRPEPPFRGRGPLLPMYHPCRNARGTSPGPRRQSPSGPPHAPRRAAAHLSSGPRHRRIRARPTQHASRGQQTRPGRCPAPRTSATTPPPGRRRSARARPSAPEPTHAAPKHRHPTTHARWQARPGRCPAPGTASVNPPSSPRPSSYSTGRRRKTRARPHPEWRRPRLCRTVRLPCSAGGVGDAVGCWGPEGCSGAGGRRRAALPCSCTPRFLARAAAFRAGRWRPARGPARNRPGHTYPYERSVIPARIPGRLVPPYVRVTLRLVPARTGTSPRPRGICPERPPTLR